MSHHRRSSAAHITAPLLLISLALAIAAIASAAADRGSGPAATAAPVISGVLSQGQTLTASTGSWTQNPTSYSYSWLRCGGAGCSPIGASGSTYTTGSADVGASLKVVVTASNKKGSGSATSAAVGPIAPPPSSPAPVVSAPSATSAPTVSGQPTAGSTLTGSNGTWSGSPTTYAYAWLSCDSTGGSCTPLTPGLGTTYLLTSADVGSTMRFSVTATNSGGNTTATSSPTAVIAPAPAPSPVVAISSPGAGTTVSGKVSFTATVSNATPTRVDFTIDGGGTFSEYQSPYVYNGDGNTLDTTTLTNGTHTLAARAYFSDGTSVAANEQVSVQNASTTPTPTVTIPSPTAGATVSGNVSFTATVANGTPTRVDFTIDGGGTFSENQSPYVYNGDGNTLDTTTLTNGTHTLAARAYFSDGSNVATSEQVNVQNTVLSSQTTPSVTGNSVMRFGTSYAWGSGYNRYDSIFVGYGDVDAAAALTARSLVYKGGVDVTDTTNTDPGLNISGVSYKQALANGWLLKDSSGNLIRPANGANTWFGDVGNSAYQKAWADNVSNFLIAHGADGVFIDNVLCSFGGLSNGVLPAQYPTDSSWATAQAAFLAYAGPALKAKGLYVAVNAYCYGPDNGSANTAWWTRIAPYVDGLMTEDFEQNPGNLAQLFFNSPTTSWMGNWLGKLDVIKAAQSAGKAAYALSYGAGTNTALMTYTKASYLMVWNGKGGGYIFNPLDSTDPWKLAWTAPVGQPNGAMTQVGGAYVRDFTTGYVVVNPSTGSVTVPLPTGLKTISGAAAGSSVTLATTTAAIFLK